MPYGSGGYAGAISSQRRQYAAAQQAQISAAQAAALLTRIQNDQFQQPQGGSGESFFGKLIPHVVEQTVSDIADVAINAIPGAFYAAQQVGEDLFTKKALTHGLLGGGAPRTTALAENMGRQMATDFRHPLRHPGYTLVDILSLGSLGTGAGSRIGSAGRAISDVRAVRAGRFLGRPPEEPPAIRAPRPSPTGPQPGDAGFEAAPLPSRGISDVAQAPVRQPTTPTPLVKNYPYRITDASGQTMEGYYMRDTTVRGRQLHMFADPYGKPRIVAPERLQNVEMLVPQITGKTGNILKTPRDWIKLAPGQKLNFHELPEAGPPTFWQKTTTRTPAAAPAVPAAGETRTATGQYTAPVEEAKPPPDVQQAEKEIAAQGQEPRVPPKIIKPDFGIDRATGEIRAGVSEFGRVTMNKIPNTDRYMIQHYEKGVATGEPVFVHGYESALAQFKRIAYEKANPTRGAEVPPRMEYLRAGGRALLTKPPAKTRQIESFREKPPVYAKPGEPIDPAELERLQNLAAQYPPEKRTFPTGASAEAAATKGIEAFPETAPLPLNVVERRLPRESANPFRTKPGERVLSTGTLTKTDVILSRSPAAALATNMWIDLLEKFPELKVGPWGRNMRAYVLFNKKEENRARAALIAAKEAGLDKQVKQLDALVKAGKTEQAIRMLDSMNDLAKIWLLYTKPGYYIANLIGQGMLTITDHAWSPGSMAHAVRMQWEMMKDPELAPHYVIAIKKGMEESGVSLYQENRGLGISQRIRQHIPATSIGKKGRNIQHFGEYEVFAKFANKILDTPFRDNAFFTEARRHGYSTWPKIKKLIDDAMAGDEAAIRQFSTITRRANRNIIDYARLGPAEKRWVRRIIFFYPWFKAATVYSGRLLAEHPLQALIANRLGVYGTQENKKFFGPLPSFMEGVIKAGERVVPGLPGKQPRVINPQAVTILGTAGQMLNAGANVVAGGGTSADQLSQFLTPALSAGVAAFTHKDPFTGADYPAQMGPLDIVADQLKNSTALGQTAKRLQSALDIQSGQKPPDQVLYPYTPGEAIGRTLFSVSPYTLNLRESQSRAAAERNTLASKREREFLKNKDYHDRYAQAGQQTGLFQQMPPELTQAFQQRAILNADLASYEQQLGHPMTMIDRMEATLGTLVRQQRMSPDQARSILTQMVGLPDSTIESYKSRITAAYFGGDVISRYRAALNAGGAGLTVP